MLLPPAINQPSGQKFAGIAVGQPVTRLPPHRSRRAELPQQVFQLMLVLAAPQLLDYLLENHGWQAF